MSLSSKVPEGLFSINVVCPLYLVQNDCIMAPFGSINIYSLYFILILFRVIKCSQSRKENRDERFSEMRIGIWLARQNLNRSVQTSGSLRFQQRSHSEFLFELHSITDIEFYGAIMRSIWLLTTMVKTKIVVIHNDVRLLHWREWMDNHI